MKKIIQLVVLSLVIFGFVACSCNSHNTKNGDNSSNSALVDTNSGLLQSVAYRTDDVFGGGNIVSGKSESLGFNDVFSKMPSSVKTFAYINLKGIRKVKFLESALEGLMEDMDGVDEFMDSVNELYMGASEISGDPEDIDSSLMEENFLMVLKGNFDKKKIKKIMKKSNGDSKEANFNGVEGIKNNNATLLFIDRGTMIATSTGFETKTLNAYLKGKSTVSKKSAEYKAMMKTNFNLLGFVGNLKGMGKVDLEDLSGGMLQGKTSFGITKLGLSLTGGKFVFDFSSILDSNDSAEEVADSMNGLVMMGRMMLGQIKEMSISESAKKDIRSLITKTKFENNGKVLSTSVSVKESTVEEFMKAMEGEF